MKMKTKITEQRVRDFLLWLRDTPHHYAGFNDDPRRTEPVKRKDGTIVNVPLAKSFTLRGRGGKTKTIAMSTFRNAHPYFEPAKSSDDRMYRPNDEGMKIINGEIEDFL